MLEQKVKEYFDLKSKIEELTKEKENLGEEIKNLLEHEPDHKFESKDGYKAKIISRTNYKYIDETAIITYLTSKGLADIYLVKKLDTTKLNKELKIKGKLYSAVKENVSESVSYNLIVDKD